MIRKKNISILIPDNKGQGLLVDYFYYKSERGFKKRFHWKMKNFADLRLMSDCGRDQD